MAAEENRELAIAAAKAASDKKAQDILVMDMREVMVLTDYFVICSGNTDRQVGSIREAVEERLAAMGHKPARREGERHRRWVLLDYVDVVVHVFRAEERAYYEIERLWKDAPLVEWEEETGKAATSR
ncbi:MAG: ribosome silencing factor [Actinomycetota bacterium]|nr:ribosome silencing factor [Actinomycetota bacterium]